MCREEVTVTIKHCGHPIETRCCNAERLKVRAPYREYAEGHICCRAVQHCLVIV